MSIRHNLFYSFGSSYAKLGLQFIASLFIARLLTPREFGVFSIAMGLIFLADTLRNFGIAGYIIQEKELTPARLNTAAGLNVLTSVFMAIVVAALAGPAAGFYGEEGVRDVMWLLAVNFLLLPVGATSMSYMRRELMFKQVSIIQFANAATGAVSTVILAYAGFSYMSLALGNVLATLTNVVLIWRMKPAHLKVRPSLAETRRVLGFGSLSTLTSLTNEAGMRLPGLLLGRLINLESVGLFDRAGSVIELFRRLVLNGLVQVTMPHFAAQVRNHQNVSASFLLAVTHLTAVGWPFFLVLALAAPWLIPVLYGDQWHDAVPLAQALCLGELALVPFYLQGQVLIAKGRMGVLTWLTLFGVLVRIPVLILLAPHGLNAAVAGYAATSLALALVSLVLTLRVVGCRAMDFWRAMAPSLAVSLIAVLVAAPAAWALQGVTVHDGVRLLGLLVAAGSGWLLGLWFTKHPLQVELLNVMRTVMNKLGRS